MLLNQDDNSLLSMTVVNTCKNQKLLALTSNITMCCKSTVLLWAGEYMGWAPLKAGAML